MTKDPAALALTAALGAAGILAVLVTGAVGLGYLQAERRSAREAAAQRAEFEAHAPLPPPPAGSSRLVEDEREDVLGSAALRAVESDPSMPEADRRTRLEEAVARFTAVLADRPDAAATLYRRGRCFDLLGRLEPALADYERAAALDPRLAEPVGRRAAELRRALGK